MPPRKAANYQSVIYSIRTPQAQENYSDEFRNLPFFKYS